MAVEVTKSGKADGWQSAVISIVSSNISESVVSQNLVKKEHKRVKFQISQLYGFKMSLVYY